jgi:hypothetical protein
MIGDISEEAKKALAEAPARRARQRLHRDGASSNEATRRRIRSFAMEREIPPEETDKLLKGRFVFPRAVEFCKKHNASIDWMMDGDLKGLQRMTQWAKAPPPELSEAHREEIMRLFSALTPRKQVIGFALLRELMVRSIPNG